MKQVLFLSYHFPPLGGVGSQRTLRYVKYLPSFGWQPLVLTVKRGAEYVIDENLLLEIPEKTPIIRTPFFDVTLISRMCGRFLPRLAGYLNAVFEVFPPDRYIGWLPFAYKRAEQIMRRERVEAIYTVSLPYTAHVVGYMLKKKTGKPWVADFRDEWTQNPFRRPRLKWQRQVDARLERRVLKAADRIVMTTQPYKAGIQSLLPEKMSDKVKVITNGFEEGDFVGRSESKENQEFRIAYVGSLYGAQDPSHFLQAVEWLLQNKLIDPRKFLLQFIGRVSPFIRNINCKLLSQYKIVRFLGFVDHRKAITHLLSADVLLLIVSSKRGSGNIPAKTFEYIAAGRPILALVPPNGAAAELIKETRTGLVVPPEDVSAIGKALLHLYTQWGAGILSTTADWNAIRNYEGKRLAGKMAGLLNNII